MLWLWLLSFFRANSSRICWEKKNLWAAITDENQTWTFVRELAPLRALDLALDINQGEADNLLQPELVAMKILAMGHICRSVQSPDRHLIEWSDGHQSLSRSKSLFTWTEPPEYPSLFCLSGSLSPSSFSTQGHQSVHPHENKWLKKHKVGIWLLLQRMQ